MSGDHNETEAQAIARAAEECKTALHVEHLPADSDERERVIRRLSAWEGNAADAPKPFTVLQTPERRAHRTTIELIKEMLEEAESGNVTEIVMVGFRANGDYLQLASPTMSHTTRIAALEDIKFEIQMAHYEEERGMHAREPRR